MMRRCAGLVILGLLVTSCSSGPDKPVEQEIDARPMTSTAPPTSTTASTTPPPSTSTPTTSAPYIASVEWVPGVRGKSLHVTPTEHGRTATASDSEVKAWVEVLRREPRAGGTSMQRQFSCHWRFARDKPTWNLEPWRPVVSMKAVIDAQCNPGGPE